MNLFFAILFLAVYYLRPQDWVVGMTGFNVVRPLMLLWIGSIVITRPRTPTPGLLRTPHDYGIWLYYIYVVWTAPSGTGALSGFLPLVAFYYLTVLSLGSWEDVQSYLRWMLVMLLAVSAMGVLQLAGLDITNGAEVTDRFVGRLSLGTWLHNNPNALGHSVIVILPLAYLLFFWRGGFWGRFVLFPASAALGLSCAIATESKGTFLVGGILTVLVFVVGRPKWVQAIVLGLAMTVGIGALSFLPRMQNMENIGSDEGVQGRLMAWDQARGAMESNLTGVGWRQFTATIDWKEGNLLLQDIVKATHCCYVQVGADLGKPGLFLWLLGLWLALRTCLFMKSGSELEERSRRALLLLLCAYLISGWMINRQYHTEHFLLIAVAAAMHRLLLHTQTQPAGVEEKAEDPEAESDSAEPEDEVMYPMPIETSEPIAAPAVYQRRLGLMDLAVTAAVTWAVLFIWDYILANL